MTAVGVDSALSLSVICACAAHQVLAPGEGHPGRSGYAPLVRPRFPASRVGLWAVAFGLASLIFEVGFRAHALTPSDFQTFLAASHRLLAGLPLYGGRFVSPPELAVVLVPLTVVPLPVAYALFVAASIGVLAWGTGSYARELGLNRWGTGLAVVLCPQGWWGLMLGQPDSLLVGLLLLAIVSVRHQRWAVAGAIGPWLLLKPDLTWPVVPLLVAATWKDALARRQLAAGLALGAITFLMMAGWLLLGWATGLAHFGGRSHFQELLSGLPDLIGGELRAAPAHQILASPFTWAIVGAGVAVMAAAGIFAGRRAMSSSQRAEWMLLVPLAIWIATSPYLHAEDALFAVPLALRLADSGSAWFRLPVLFILLPWVVFPTWGALAAIPALGLAAAGIALLVRETGTGTQGSRVDPAVAT
jgi:hypothetical protein